MVDEVSVLINSEMVRFDQREPVVAIESTLFTRRDVLDVFGVKNCNTHLRDRVELLLPCFNINADEAHKTLRHERYRHVRGPIRLRKSLRKWDSASKSDVSLRSLHHTPVGLVALLHLDTA